MLDRIGDAILSVPAGRLPQHTPTPLLLARVGVAVTFRNHCQLTPYPTKIRFSDYRRELLASQLDFIKGGFHAPHVRAGGGPPGHCSLNNPRMYASIQTTLQELFGMPPTVHSLEAQVKKFNSPAPNTSIGPQGDCPKCREMAQKWIRSIVDVFKKERQFSTFL